jgi:hypothetical protein
VSNRAHNLRFLRLLAKAFGAAFCKRIREEPGHLCCLQLSKCPHTGTALAYWRAQALFANTVSSNTAVGAVNAMLLNEFLKEHRAFVEEQHKVAQQQEEIDILKAELKEQRSLIQKVSDKVELKRSTSQLVANKP